MVGFLTCQKCVSRRHQFTGTTPNVDRMTQSQRGNNLEVMSPSGRRGIAVAYMEKVVNIFYLLSADAPVR